MKKQDGLVSKTTERIIYGFAIAIILVVVIAGCSAGYYAFRLFIGAPWW